MFIPTIGGYESTGEKTAGAQGKERNFTIGTPRAAEVYLRQYVQLLGDMTQSKGYCC